MSFYMDMSSLLNTFKTKLTVYPIEKSKGNWVNGIWEENEVKPLKVEEPFIPNSRNSFLYSSVILIENEAGKISEYNATWISKGDYCINTTVEHNNKKYIVKYIKDLSDYSNVHIYYLEGQS